MPIRWLVNPSINCGCRGEDDNHIRLGAAAKPSRLFVVCRACSTAGRCKSSTQPDGGEELAKRKGVVARRGLKEAWSKGASR